MSTKAAIAPRLPLRRALGEGDAALYVGLSASKFRLMVADGEMPRPRLAGRRKLWDVDELDMAFKCLPRDGGEEADTWADFNGGDKVAAR